ncbi:MAG: tRNA (guanosine(46)-N7)-methyltransferase TrmB [Candidatus Marinimicrobia bacterium]|nr:tRNA (guanosine(46)-N7)-methyltransferase TrmB [Candidatus Neomarinimicrobiota bacterium]
MTAAAGTQRADLELRPVDWLRPLDWTDVWDQASGPVEVDVGCGKGRFLLARAARFPASRFLGIDRQLRRLRKIERAALRGGALNIRLLRADAAYVTPYLLPDASVDTFYIFFPDPWPKKKHWDKRLLDDAFVDALAAKCKPGALVHFATDHLAYFESVRTRFEARRAFAPCAPFAPRPEERTDFELLFSPLGPIGRCSFRRTRS